jgi:predicted protein tyrosine phosphatase
MVIDLKNVKIFTGAVDNQTLSTQIAKNEIKNIDIVEKAPKKRKIDKRTEEKILSKDEREENLKTLIEDINEVDEDTDKYVLSKAQSVNKIIDFIKNNYLNEKKILNV